MYGNLGTGLYEPPPISNLLASAPALPLLPIGPKSVILIEKLTSEPNRGIPTIWNLVWISTISLLFDTYYINLPIPLPQGMNTVFPLPFLFIFFSRQIIV